MYIIINIFLCLKMCAQNKYSFTLLSVISCKHVLQMCITILFADISPIVEAAEI